MVTNVKKHLIVAVKIGEAISVDDKMMNMNQGTSRRRCVTEVRDESKSEWQM